MLLGLRGARTASGGMEAQLEATEEALARERRRVEALEAELRSLRCQPGPKCPQAGAVAPGAARCACAPCAQCLDGGVAQVWVYCHT